MLFFLKVGVGVLQWTQNGRAEAVGLVRLRLDSTRKGRKFDRSSRVEQKWLRLFSTADGTGRKKSKTVGDPFG